MSHMMLHWPLAQAAVPCDAAEQSAPQPPQLFGSVDVGTQRSVHQSLPAGQQWPIWQVLVFGQNWESQSDPQLPPMQMGESG
jgi:hypothetical protein